MVGIVLSVGHDVIRQDPRHVVLKIHHGVDNAIESTGRQKQVAVIRQHGRFAEESTAQGNAGRVKLREVQLNNIVLRDEFGCDPTECGRNDTFADTCRHRHTDDLDTMDGFYKRQGRVELRGHHGHLMSAFGKGTREAFGIYGQPGSVRAVIGEDGQDFHKRKDYTLWGIG